MRTLTARQSECLVLASRGLSNGEIASEIYVAKHTVDYHLQCAYLRLGVKNRMQAVNEARRLGLIP